MRAPQKNAITFRVGYPFGSNDETNMAYDGYYDYFVDYNLDFEISNLFSSLLQRNQLSGISPYSLTSF